LKEQVDHQSTAVQRVRLYCVVGLRPILSSWKWFETASGRYVVGQTSAAGYQASQAWVTGGGGQMCHCFINVGGRAES